MDYNPTLLSPMVMAFVKRSRVKSYVVVGLVAALVFMGLGKLLRTHFGFAMVLAAAISFIASLFPAYIGHRRFTFRSAGAKSAELPRFLASNLLCFGLTLASTQFFATKLGLPDLVALALTSLVVPIFNFLLLSCFVFIQPQGISLSKQVQ